MHQQRERHTVFLDLVALERRGQDGNLGQWGAGLDAEATCLARQPMSAARSGDLPARRDFNRQVDQEEIAGLLLCACGEVGPRQRKPPRPRHERDIRLIE